MNNSPSSNWERHVEKTKNHPPRQQLLDALKYCIEPPQHVLELGGGALNDAQYLLSLGAAVTVVDNEPSIQTLATKLANKKLFVHTGFFDAYEFPVEAYDLITALYSLSFNPPETFTAMIQRAQQSLKKGGIFSGNIFGSNDDWKGNPAMTFLDRAQVEKLFEDMDILYLEEVERDNTLADGRPKHWHEVRVIARGI